MAESMNVITGAIYLAIIVIFVIVLKMPKKDKDKGGKNG